MTNKFVIMTPYWGNPDWDNREPIAALEKHFGCLHIITRNCAYIDVARSAIVEGALTTTDAEVFVFIDHDIIFHPSEVVSLVNNCHESDYDVLGGAYGQRKHKGMLFVDPVKTNSIDFYSEGLHECNVIGLGFSAIKRHVFETLRETLPRVKSGILSHDFTPYFLPYIDEDGFYVPEDISFFNKVKQAGFKIGIDAARRIKHRGVYDYRIEDSVMEVPEQHSVLHVEWQGLRP